MAWLKEHWELLVIAFGFGGIIQRDLDKEHRLKKIEKAISEDIPAIREMVARIDERTKRL